MHLLFVHGVGLGSASFSELAELARHRGLPVTLFDRRGYDGRSATADLRRHVDDLATCVDELSEIDGPVVVAGVSGGATLTLALAATRHPRLHAAVVHEPLVGPVAPTQHQVVTSSIDRLRADPSDHAFDDFMERLLQPATWTSLPPLLRRAALDHEAAARIETPGFGGHQLGAAGLSAASAVTTWTVGERSPRWRHDAATVGREAGIPVQVVSGTHTPQLECPSEWLDVILTAAGAR